MSEVTHNYSNSVKNISDVAQLNGEMLKFKPHDEQDIIFIQILENVKIGNNILADQLILKLGDYTNKAEKYSKYTLSVMVNIIGGHHILDQISGFAANLFADKLYTLSYFIYCMASHVNYVNGFSWGFLHHFIRDQWSHTRDNNHDFIPFEKRNIKMLKYLIHGLDKTQHVKFAEHIQELFYHITPKQFVEILDILKDIPEFSLRNGTHELFIELAKTGDDDMLNYVTNDIIY